MKLNDLLNPLYHDIVIQCHNNPDADAIASGFGILRFFEAHGANSNNGPRVRLVYGGDQLIRKSDLVLMIDLLNIPINHVQDLQEPDLLITVDCQYGEKNVSYFPAKSIAVIDHHQPGTPAREAGAFYFRPEFGSCSTIIWDMLDREGMPGIVDEAVATALYYGLYMDTAGLKELRHPRDRDMRDALEFRSSKKYLFRMENCNLSLEELKLASEALAGYTYLPEWRCALTEARKCDPNILGIISDMLISVDSVDVAVVYSNLETCIKYSVRSAMPHTRANELSSYIGDGGGHVRKAGGRLSMEEAQKQSIPDRVEQYFSDHDIYDVKKGILPEDMDKEPLFEKKQLRLGYVKATDLGYLPGTQLLVRELEGDIEIMVNEDTYLIIGVEDEIYTNTESFFLSHNIPTEEPYVFTGKYAPMIRNDSAVSAVSFSGDSSFHSVVEHAKVCYSRSGSIIHARLLTRRTKVFSRRSEEYYLGKPGDWLAMRAEDPDSIYIIKKEIMEKTYDRVCEED